MFATKFAARGSLMPKLQVSAYCDPLLSLLFAGDEQAWASFREAHTDQCVLLALKFAAVLASTAQLVRDGRSTWCVSLQTIIAVLPKTAWTRWSGKAADTTLLPRYFNGGDELAGFSLGEVSLSRAGC
jgi:hypothetical protein